MINDKYSDFLNSFRSHPATKDALRVLNEGAIIQSIRNLLLTNPGERVFQPQLGAGISQLLFESNTPDILDVLSERIRTTIERYEPRVKLVDVEIDSPEDSNAVNIVLTFFILLNSDTPIRLPLTIRRVR